MKRLSNLFESSTPKLISGSNTSLSVPLLASLLIHAFAILWVPKLMNYGRNPLQQHFIPIALIENPPVVKEEETPTEHKKTLPSIERKVEKPVSKKEIIPMPRPAQPAASVEPTKPMETKTNVTPNPENVPNFAPTAPIGGGGSEVGAENLFGKDDVGVLPGAGTAGGGGAAASGLGRGSGSPGLPAPNTMLKTNREAKPIQTARAAYPPMALRMGLEGDVTLRIEIDTEGKVTKAEVIRSAGLGFDEEALRAVKQSRFEPAQKDGQKVPAEFMYVFHFRLSK